MSNNNKCEFCKDYVYAVIEPIVGHDSVIGCEWFTYEADIKQVKNIIRALEMLGKEVTSIKLSDYIMTNNEMNDGYYRRIPEEIRDKAYNQLCSWQRGQTEVFIKKDRLYMNVDGYDFVLPREIWSDFDNKTLHVSIYFK